jgi:hypothetical protein
MRTPRVLRAPFFHSVERILPMRIHGRVLRPSNLAERRVLKSLGFDMLRVRRGLNPFIVCRHVNKLATGRGGDMLALRALLQRNTRATPITLDLPDSTPEPRGDERAA